MHPIIAKIGPLTIYSYGMMVAIAFLFGIFIAKLEAVRKNIKPDLLYDFSFYLIIGSIIGARIYYILFFDAGLLKNPIDALKVWQGGLSIHGAILAGIVTGLVFSRLKKISFWALADLVSPSIILGQAIGRIGCYLNGCCSGINSQPTQIYELILDFIGFLLLWNLRKRIKFEGGLFLLYLMFYSVIRIVVSQFRADNLYLGGTSVTLAGATSVGIFLTALAVFFAKRKNG